jgi:putative transposase
MINDIKHVCNRGIDKNDIFADDHDRQRFVDSLYKFNNEGGAIRSRIYPLLNNPPPQEKIVEILMWTLIPNHFHLLLQEKVEGGISEFINRLGNGYTKYFNIRHKRSGFLFQNRTKMILLENNRQFLYIPYYIDLNILDVISPNWKRDKVRNAETALRAMGKYKWSSFYDYFNNNNRDLSCVINQELFYNLFNINKKKYEKELLDFIKNPIEKSKLD